jgi:hypothetical protein
MAKKRRKKRRQPGRPATGRDPIIPVRLPKKLLADIEAWAMIYRTEHELVVNRSTAIRCLILLGLESLQHRVVDPKTKLTYEGETPALLRFYRRGTVTRWLIEGTGKTAKRMPQKPSNLATPKTMPTKVAVSAAADRAEARSKKRNMN